MDVIPIVLHTFVFCYHQKLSIKLGMILKLYMINRQKVPGLQLSANSSFITIYVHGVATKETVQNVLVT